MSNYNELRLTYEGGQQTAITLSSNIIQDYEYEFQDIVAVEVPEIVEEIGQYAFCDNYLTSITLNEGLEIIHNQAFQHGTYSAITIPSTVTYIGANAFNINEEQGDGLAGNLTITCLATIPPTLEDGERITFGDPSKITAIYVPEGCAEAYREASGWSYYASLITEGQAPPEESFTQFDITAAYIGYDQVEKIYLGSDIMFESGGTPPEPTSYSAAPLTIRMLTGGTIKWSIQGSAASTAASRQVFYTINEYGYDKAYEKSQYFDSSTAGETWDLAEDDFICFYGNNPTYAESLIQNNRYQYPQNYNTLSGSTGLFEIEGNVMSLVDQGTFADYGGEYYDPDAWYQLSAATDYAFSGLFRGCTGLTNAENMVFPWYSLGKMACGNMFKDCSQLTKSPHLNAPNVTTGDSTINTTYGSMFMNCSSLREITCMISATSIAIHTWVQGVPTGSTGDFYRQSGSTWYNGNNGMPSGWTIHNVTLNDV